MENLAEAIEEQKPVKPAFDLTLLIEEKRRKTKENYIDCVVLVCEDLGIEIEQVGEHIPKNIKEKIEADALKLNLLKYKLNTLM